MQTSTKIHQVKQKNTQISFRITNKEIHPREILDVRILASPIEGSDHDMDIVKL